MRSRVAWLALAALATACDGVLAFDDRVDGSASDGSATDAAFDGASSDGAPASCNADSACKLPSLHCDVVSGACVACIDDAQCATSALRRCDVALHRCVQCAVASGLLPPEYLEDMTYFVGHEVVIPSPKPGMALWREGLFAFMKRNAERTGAFFGVPTRQVVEVGTEIEI